MTLHSTIDKSLGGPSFDRAELAACTQPQPAHKLLSSLRSMSMGGHIAVTLARRHQ